MLRSCEGRKEKKRFSFQTRDQLWVFWRQMDYGLKVRSRLIHVKMRGMKEWRMSVKVISLNDLLGLVFMKKTISLDFFFRSSSFFVFVFVFVFLVYVGSCFMSIASQNHFIDHPYEHATTTAPPPLPSSPFIPSSYTDFDPGTNTTSHHIVPPPTPQRTPPTPHPTPPHPLKSPLSQFISENHRPRRPPHC
jgi:hypothetical protein